MLQMDFTRINAEISQAEARVAQMQEFRKQRVAKLVSAASDIEALLVKHKCVLPKMENAFSAGYGMDEYSTIPPIIAMKITCKATLTEGVKNIELYRKRLAAAWPEAVGNKYDIHINGLYINGGTVEIHLLVK